MTDAAPSTVTAGFAGAQWWITHHALARWLERYSPDATPAVAAAQLAEVSRTALDTGTETRNGRAIYLHPNWPNARFIIAREPRPRLSALVTILDNLFIEAAIGRRKKPRR